MIDSLLETADAYIKRVLNEIIYKQLGDNFEICDEFNKLSKRALAVPSTTEELIAVEEYMIFVESKYLDQLTEKILYITQFGTDLMEATSLSAEHLQASQETINWLYRIKPIMDECIILIEKVKYDFESRLREKTEKLNKDLEDVCPSLEFLNNLDDSTKIYEYVLFIKTFLRKIEQFDSVVQWINKEEMLFKYPLSTYPDLDELKSIVHPLAKLIFLSNKWFRTKKLWMDGSFDKLVKHEVEETMTSFHKNYLALQQMYKAKCKQQANDNNPKRFKGVVDDPDFSNWPAPLKIISQTIDSIKDFQQHIPVISILGNPALRDRHWTEMSNLIGLNLRPSAGTTLRKVSKLDLKNFLPKFEVVSISATKELELQQKLEEVKNEWMDVHFTTELHPTSGIIMLSNIEEIQTLIDDHIIRTLSIRRSAFIQPIKENAREWFETLTEMTEVLELWTLLEERWLYFLNLFNSQTIATEVPKIYSLYHDVNKTLHNLTSSIEKEGKVLKTVGQRDVRWTIKKSYDRLETVSLHLHDFIDKKRLCFPRFYFLSNPEVMDILSEFANPSRVQPFLLKCFAGINSLGFNSESEIVSMSSVHGETIQFSNKISVPPMSPVEKWLAEVEQEMKLTMDFEIRKCLSINETEADLFLLIENRPSQVLLCIWHINWTSEVQKCLKRANYHFLQNHIAAAQTKLDESINLIASNLTSGQRHTLEALMVLQSHCLQVMRSFTPEDMSEINFKWLSQPRYLWKDSVKFQMMSALLPYSYEYLGEVSRLVITPLTTRCFVTLVNAFQLHLFGSIEGPTATGKTETVKDLCEMLAVLCATFNCSNFLHYSVIGKFFKGLAFTGAWVCFDDFDRIEVGVLSVVAQQLISISQAIQNNAELFIFEGTEIRLNNSCYVCIVMNPKYESVSILPDNLKALFRNIAMIKPDVHLVAEVMLQCFGFIDVKNLSSKLVIAYERFHTLLSRQSHYNFGLGAIRFNLMHARDLKIEHPVEKESLILARSVAEINIPKLHSSDVDLFHEVLQSVFPEHTRSMEEHNIFEESVIEVCKKKNLQAHKCLISKMKEIMDMLNITPGVLLVGESFCGKTTILQVLIEVLHQTTQIDYSFINPKSVTIESLYGEFNRKKNVWVDGIFSSIFRKYAADESDAKRKWIIFDGPVDPIWVENIKSVLDPTETLSLSSGENIRMSDSMSFLFETTTLKEASPGTIARCNVIYVDPTALSWQHVVDSWMACLPKEWINFRAVFVTMFNWLIPPCLSFVETSCTKVLRVTNNKIVKSLTQFVKMLLSDALDENDQNFTHFLIWIQAVFLYAGHWSFGGTLNSDSRLIFDEFYKNLWRGDDENNLMPATEELEKIEIVIPVDGSLFDYYYQFKAKGSWKYWPEFVRNFKIDESSNIQQVLVPTVDAARYNYVLDMHIRHGVPALLFGPTGTGKSFYIQNLLTSHLSMEKFVPGVITLSSLSTPKYIQDMIISKLLRYKHKTFGPPSGKRGVLFIDDVHMPLSDQYGTKPAIELLKFLLDYNFVYNLKTKSEMDFHNLVFIASMGSVSSENYSVSLRFLHQFNCFKINSFSDEIITRIFSTLIMAGFRRNGFSTELYPVAVSIISSTLEMYKFSMKYLLPTPTKSHYMFSLSDFARVVYGCILCRRESVDSKRVLVRLWAHEALRVFYDRLVEEDDRQVFYDKMMECVSGIFKEDIGEMFEGLYNTEQQMNKEAFAELIFSVILDQSPDDRKYEEVPSVDHFYDAAMQVIEDYNATHQNKMSIVLFKYAVEHLSRICRILSIPGGNALLVGVGGSGRQSLTRLAGAVCRQRVFQPKITKNYSLNEWRACLRELLEEAGVCNRPCVFIFSEGQFKEDWFLQDIHYLLSTGEVPGIFTIDQHLEIIQKVRLAAQGGNRNVDMSPLAVERFFINRCKQNLHLCMCFSPAGSFFKHYLRIFPSLIKCSTIDWFEPVVPVHIDGKTYFFEGWPEEAMNNVAIRYLAPVNLNDDVKAAAVQACKFFHVVARKISDDYLKATGRKTYVTTAAYLELIQTYVQFTTQKQEEIMAAKMRYVGGLDKLDFAAEQVTVMQKDLNSLQPQLKAAAEQTEGMMKVIERETKQVEETSAQVREDEKIVNQQAKSANQLKEECETDLALAIPILEEAISALNTLKPTDITLVKSMKNPPDAIKLVMAAVCVMKDIKPEKIPDPNKPGSKMIDYWGPSKRLLGDMSFLQSLKEYDKDNIPPAIMATIRKQYLPHKDFKPQIVAKASSAAEGLCKWIIAMDMYDAVAKEVAPKKAKFDLAQKKFEATMAILIEKRNQVVELEEKLEILKEQLEQVQVKKRALEEEVNLCAGKLKKAENLISSLGGERARWTQKAKDLQHRYDCIPGDILLSCGIISYLSPYTADFRQPQIELWKRYLTSLKIPCSENYDIVTVLGSEVKIQQWNICRLPHDSFSIENAIIQDCSKRWALMLDPQRQANKWIKVMEKPNSLEVIKADEAHYIKKIKVCMETGRPVLIENVLEELDPLLDPILLKQTFTQESRRNSQKYIALGDEIIEYHPAFKLYLTSSLRNPHLAPEVYNIVTVLNFALSVSGLEDKLSSIVIAKERPDLADKNTELTLEHAENRKALLAVEDSILRALSECTGNILEDEGAAATLDESKLVAAKIIKKQEAAKADRKVVQSFHMSYQSVAAHCAVLYYCISDLPNIDPMYQFSLDWFINKFIQSIESAKKSTVTVKRVHNLKQTFTLTLYVNVCRSLFDRHKLLFSFILCSSIMMKYERLDVREMKFLVRSKFQTDLENPISWLPASSWSQLCCIDTLSAFQGFKQSFLENLTVWHECFNSEEQFPQLPAPWSASLTSFQQLIVLKMLQPEKLIPCIVKLIESELSSKFTSSPPFDINASFADSNCLTPIVFILSPGTDPMKSLIQFSHRMNFTNKFQSLSLGHGQESVVMRLIKEAQTEGNWLCLQNCHLASSWLTELENVCKNFDLSNTAPTFRLWLTSSSCDQFPTHILHTGVKMVVEAPIRLQQNLLSNYLSDPIKDPDFFESCPGKDGPFTKLLYSVSFFHAVIQERETFGSIGWNVPYGFNESDFHISITQLQMLINDYSAVPYGTINYIIGECNYGGRITDELDRKLLITILSNYCNADIVNDPNYLFNPGNDKTQIPICSDYHEFVSSITELPFIAPPEIFGLHINAGMRRDLESTRTFLKTLSLVQESGWIDDSSDFYLNALHIADEILERLPERYDFQGGERGQSESRSFSLTCFLSHELNLFNCLRLKIQSSLSNLQNGVKGIILMNSQLDEIARALNNNQCPAVWFKSSYPSTKSLSNYVTDFTKRFGYLKKWYAGSHPTSVWLSSFFHVNAFLHTCLHEHAKSNNISADILSFDHEVLSLESMSEAPVSGVYGFGFYLEGARWDRNMKCLQEQYVKVLFDAMPVIWFKPVLQANLNAKDRFLTPLYQTPERKGRILVLGSSSNFITNILLSSEVPHKHWIMRGVALLCQLSD
nr:PREDICTED: dynein heavy chain 7, axonemal [Bemisia tabaci]